MPLTLHLPLRKILCRVAGVIICLGAVVVITVFVVVKCTRQPFSPPDTSQWQTGDVFFSAGNAWQSTIVRAFGGESIDRSTHCGFILINHGQPMLVHMSTEYNQITAETIDQYAQVNDVSSIKAMRVTPPLDTVALRRYLQYNLSIHRPFDHRFSHSDTTQFYCTELIIQALLAQQRTEPAYLLNLKFIYPADIETLPSLRPLQ